MAITDPLVLPADVILTPVEALSTQVRQQVKYEDGDYAITRPKTRTLSKIIDAQAADLLKEFQTPKTIVEAVIRYSRAKMVDPEDTLVEAFPMLQGFIQSRLLAPADSDEANRIVPSFEAGDQLQGFEIVRCIQALEDTELYQIKRNNSEFAVFKVLRPNFTVAVSRMFEREATILQRLDGSINPVLLETGKFEGRSYLVMEWCSGVDVLVAAEELRRRPGVAGQIELLRLCCAVLDAYAHLHAQDVIHSDIHPRNIVVTSGGGIKILDYGLARLEDTQSDFSRAHRAGIGFFFEPEYAQACLAQQMPPQSSMPGEQYALAALLYLLLTGAHYLDFSLEQQEMLRQIAKDVPLPFTQRGVRAWPEVESLLTRALSKRPSDRFPSVAEFASSLKQVALAVEQSAPQILTRATPVDYPAAEELLSDVLQRLEPSGLLFTSGLTTAPTCSVNYGAAGLAYALYRIACVWNDAALLSWADLWVTKAMHHIESDGAFYNTDVDMTPETIGQISPYHSRSGVHCVHAFISHAMSDLVSQQAAIESFVLASNAPCENLDLTLGRSSTLLACSLLFDAAPKSNLVDNSSLFTLGNKVMQDIWDEVSNFASIHEDSNIGNLGIAHGWAGLLYATMRWGQSAGTPLPRTVEERLQQLAECAEPIGRGVRWQWIVSENRSKNIRNYMPGWCNGSAGFIYLWTLAHQVYHNEAYLRLAERAAWNTWEEPDSVSSLCCGLAGRAYALLNLYKHTGEPEWLYRAQDLTNRAAIAKQTLELFRNSLYKGEIGIAVLTADLSKPEESCMPFFEQEGWPAGLSSVSI